MPKPFEKIVVASGNQKKIVELQAALGSLDIQCLPQSAFNVPEAPEPHLTFIENALAKARHCAGLTHLPSLADDSGLCVPALGGSPGVFSGRYANENGVSNASDEANNAKLLNAMRALFGEARNAYFVSCIVLARSATDPEPIICLGRWHGSIVNAPRGANGFGYDCLFQPQGLLYTAAQLSFEQKAKMSHRARAMGSLLAQLADS